jgi:hypothetical protein
MRLLPARCSIIENGRWKSTDGVFEQKELACDHSEECGTGLESRAGGANRSEEDEDVAEAARR